MKLLIATTNKKKLNELRELLAGLNLELVCLADLASYQEVPENGNTFQENACLKALGYAVQSGLLTLGEDSGLCCEALEGAPGVYSARYAGPGKDDLENNDKILSVMKDFPDEQRTAYFASSIALARPDRLIGVVEGRVYGKITRQICGTNGFGYDPIFFYPPYEKTFGQVSAEMKHRVSHRAQALEKAKKLLKEYLKQIV